MHPKHKDGEWDGDIFDDPTKVAARSQIILALEQGPEPMKRQFVRKLHWMRQCGEFPVSVEFRDGRVERVYRNRCRCRGCLVCDTLLAADVRALVVPVAEEREKAGARFSMITLTMPHKLTDLAQKNLSLLFLATRAFQRSQSFRKHVRGYARGVEVPWTPANGFHPHVHYVVEATKWPKADLKAAWTKAMASVGGPYVPPNGAHIKGIKNVGKGLREAIGYPFKSGDLCTMPLAELCQLLYATKRRHMTQVSRNWSKRGKAMVEARKAEASGLEIADGSVRIETRELFGLIRTGHEQAFDLAVKVAEFMVENPGTLAMGHRLQAMLRQQDEYSSARAGQLGTTWASYEDAT